MSYNPRSVFQAYQQYGQAKSKQAANAKKSTGLGSSRSTGGGRGSVVEKSGERAAAMQKQKPNIDQRIWSAAARWMGITGGKDSEPEPVTPVPMKVYERPEFKIPEPVPVSVAPIGGYDEVGRNFGTSMGIDPYDPRGRDQRALPQNTYQSTINTVFKGGGRDEPVKGKMTPPKGLMSPPSMQQPDSGIDDDEMTRLAGSITAPKSAPNTYTVVKGDTLSDIAKDYGTTVEELVKINNIKDKDKIYTGQTIKLQKDFSEPTEAGTTADPVDATEAAETFTTETADNVDFDFIAEQEGAGINKGYVPTKRDGSVDGKSGVTVGTGVDLGSKNDEYFEGLDENIKRKLRPHYGKKKSAAQESLKNNPLVLTDTEVAALDRFVKEKELNDLKDQWNKDSDINFDSLPTNKATVVASVYYQYKNDMVNEHNFWKQVTSGDWDAALGNLRDYEDEYPSRRNREADYLESGEM